MKKLKNVPIKKKDLEKKKKLRKLLGKLNRIQVQN